MRLEIGIGLQSANDFVREVCVNTSFDRSQFEAAIDVIHAVGALAKPYLMIKPPFLTEEEGIADVIESVAYLAELGLRSVTLCPTRVARSTLAWELYQAGLYAPPNLWSVLDVVRSAHARLETRVACINLRGTDFDSVFPESCPTCADRIVDSLVEFSVTGDPSVFPDQCACRPHVDMPVVSLPPVRAEVVAARMRAMLQQLDGARRPGPSSALP